VCVRVCVFMRVCVCVCLRGFDSTHIPISSGLTAAEPLFYHHPSLAVCACECVYTRAH